MKSAIVSLAFEDTAIVYNKDYNLTLDRLKSKLLEVYGFLNHIEAIFLAEILLEKGLVINYQEKLNANKTLIERNVEYSKFEELLEEFEEAVLDNERDYYLNDHPDNIKKQILEFVKIKLQTIYK